MSHKVPIKQQPFAHQVSFCSSSKNLCREAVESIFMSSFKESDQLKTSGKVWIVKLYLGLDKYQVMKQMQAREHSQLWLGLCRLVQISKMMSGVSSIN